MSPDQTFPQQPAGITRVLGNRTPRRVQWARAVDEDAAHESDVASVHALDEAGLDVRGASAFRLTTQRLFTASCVPNTHARPRTTPIQLGITTALPTLTPIDALVQGVPISPGYTETIVARDDGARRGIHRAARARRAPCAAPGRHGRGPVLRERGACRDGRPRALRQPILEAVFSPEARAPCPCTTEQDEQKRGCCGDGTGHGEAADLARAWRHTRCAAGAVRPRFGRGVFDGFEHAGPRDAGVACAFSVRGPCGQTAGGRVQGAAFARDAPVARTERRGRLGPVDRQHDGHAGGRGGADAQRHRAGYPAAWIPPLTARSGGLCSRFPRPLIQPLLATR